MPTNEGRNVARKICEYQIAHKAGDNPYWTSKQMLALFKDLDTKDEEIARITTLNTQQTRRMIHLTVLAVGCSQHSSYRARRKVTTFCETCNLMWEASQALKEMAQEEEKSGG